MDSGSQKNSFRDAIITLPMWAVILIAMISGTALVASLWVAVTSTSSEIKTTAMQLLLVLVPLASAVVAAIALRRTSTAQIDRLVTSFLEKTMLHRFQKWCRSSYGLSDHRYPFSAVNLVEPTDGRSYAYFDLQWRDSPNKKTRIGIKANVFNFEVFTTLELRTDSVCNTDIVISKTNLHKISQDPILKYFIGAIQGSINEGYEIKVEYFAPKSDGDANVMPVSFSFRQKVRENFLASPFIKRYLAEDAVILTSVLHNEYMNSGFYAAKDGH
jgi:hypothetical protein